MIQKFVEEIEKILGSSTAILSSNIHKHFGPDGKTVYLKGSLLFINSSVLELAIFANESHNDIQIDKYRFHYMNKHGAMIFRYDNAPHHELPSFPHHKHLPAKVVVSETPTIKDVLNEISSILLQ